MPLPGFLSLYKHYQQEQITSPIPCPYLILTPLSIGRVWLGNGEQRKAPKRWFVASRSFAFIAAGGKKKKKKYLSKHSLKCEQNLPGLISETLLKRDREVLECVDWSRTNEFIFLGACLSLYMCNNNINDKMSWCLLSC